MGLPLIPSWFNLDRSKWIKCIFFVAIGIFIFFEPPYNWFFGKVLAFKFIGLRILAYILAVWFFILAYDAKKIG